MEWIGPPGAYPGKTKKLGEIIEAFLNDTEHYISLQTVESLINNLLKIKYKHISVQLIPDGIIIRANK